MNTVAPPAVVTTLRPRYQGANIRSWIGFKHLLYLVEEAVITWFREHGAGPQRLFHEHGLRLHITEGSFLLQSLLEIDDAVMAETTLLAPGRLGVRLSVAIPGGPARTILTGKQSVALIGGAVLDRPIDLPEDVAGFRRPEDALASDTRCDLDCDQDAPAVLAATRPTAIHWPWVARYFQCHYSNWLQYSAYVRALEEVVDRFLAARGLSIGHMLDTRGLIPVVSRVRVQVLSPVDMEETLHTVFVVDDILMDSAFDGRMDCYVQRGRTLRHVATARILHGYAFCDGPQAGRLAPLDAGIRAALTGGKA